MKASNKKSVLSVNVQHDYITLKAPHGTFTIGRRGTKATGVFMEDATFKALDKYITNGDNYGDAMKKLTDPAFLTTLAPNWDVTVEDIEAGDVVTVTEPLFKEYFGKQGEVEYVKKKYAFVTFVDGQHPVGIDKLVLKIVEKKNK